MQILPDITVEKVKNCGNDKQIAAVEYFDKNGNGIIEREEADSFIRSKIEKTPEQLTITSIDGYSDTFENVKTRKSSEYYKQGTIPVAVIDSFYGNGAGAADHGYMVSNIIKSKNPDISLTQINSSVRESFNPLQSFVSDYLTNHPDMEEKLYENSLSCAFLENVVFNKLDEAQFKSYIKAFEKVKKDIDNGISYKAVNLSAGYDVNYDEINKIISSDLGFEINPENIGKYKEQIKTAFKNHKDETISYGSHKGEFQIKISKLLDLIEKIESLKTPVYIAGSYKYDNEGTMEAFNFLALANNAKSCEAGKQTGDGKIIHDNDISHNSLSIGDDGKRRIADSLCYNGYSLIRGSTSFAVPMVLAKELKAK